MSRNRFVDPDVDRLPLSDGDWIEVKRRLNVGEQKRLEAAGVKRSLVGPPEVDWEEYNVGRLVIWLTDWSFRDGEDRPVDLSLDAVRALEPETFAEMQEALSKHILEQQRKKARQTAATV